MSTDREDAALPDASAPDAWLDDLLVADGAAQRAAYIEDAGFTARVTAAIPRPAALPEWRRPTVMAMWGAALIALVFAMPTLFVDLLRMANRLVAEQPFSLGSVGIVLAAVVALTSAAAAYSLREND